MKILTLIASLAFCLIVSTTTGAHATCIGHPAGATATYQGGFTIELTVSPACSVRCDVCTWLTSGGQTDFTLDASSITFSNPCSGIDTTTPALFNMLAQAAIAQGYALGYIRPSGTCATATTTRVYQASCVQRTGSGATTHFTPCNPSAFSARIYKVCAPEGLNITLFGSEAGSCGIAAGGCEPTCP